MRALRIIAGIVGALLFAVGVLLVVLAATEEGGFTAVGWVITFVLLVLGLTLAVLAFTARPSRPCPRCGKNVKRGLVVCPTCGFDFGTLVPGGASEPDQQRPVPPAS